MCINTTFHTEETDRQTRKHDLYDFSISDVLLVSEGDEGVVGRVSEQQELLGQDSVRMFRELGEWEWDRQVRSPRLHKQPDILSGWAVIFMMLGRHC